MSEIRNLTRNGETFYPLTHIDGLLDENGTPVKVINDIFDVSEYNATSDPLVPQEYSDLSAALLGIPQEKQKPGMTIRFIESTEHKYLQYRLMSSSWSTVVSNWLGIEDEPVIGSENIVKSGGIQDTFIDVENTIINQITSKYQSDGPMGDFFTLVSNQLYLLEPKSGTNKGIIRLGISGSNRLYYSSEIIPKGTIINYQGTSSIGRAQNAGCTKTNPATLETLEGFEVDNYRHENAIIGFHDFYFIMPYDGYFVYQYNIENWTDRVSRCWLNRVPVNDEIPIPDSNSLVKSDGLYKGFLNVENTIINQITSKYQSDGPIGDSFTLVSNQLYLLKGKSGTNKGIISLGISANNMLYYSTNIIPKGTILNYQGTSSVNRGQYAGCTKTNPATLETLEGLEVDNYRHEEGESIGFHDFYFIMPYDGYFIYQYNKAGWTDRASRCWLNKLPESTYASIMTQDRVPITITTSYYPRGKYGPFYLNGTKWTVSSTAQYRSLVYPVAKGDYITIKANQNFPTRYAFVIVRNQVNGQTVIFADNSTTYQEIQPNESIILTAPATCFLYVFSLTSTLDDYFPSDLKLWKKNNESNLFPSNQYNYLSWSNKVIVPSSEDTFNFMYDSGQNYQFYLGGNSYQRLCYFPNVIVKGGEKIIIHRTDKDSFRVFQLPEIPLDTIPYNLISKFLPLSNVSYEKDTTDIEITLHKDTRRIAIVLNGNNGTATYPSTITEYITSVELPVVDINSRDNSSVSSIFNTNIITYSGPKINLTNYCGYTSSSAAFGTSGTCANYGKYSFTITSDESTWYLVNLETMSKVATFTQEPKDRDIFHSNCATFINQRYDESDYFPLLYISVWGADQEGHPNQPSINVYRIIPTFTDGEISSFTATIVQVVWLTATTSDNGHGNPNILYDKGRNCLWSIGSQRDSSAPNYLTARLFKYPMPTSLDAEVSIDITENWLLTDSGALMQGAIIMGDNIIIARGRPQNDIGLIYVINVLTHEIVNVIDFLHQGLNLELEGFAYYSNKFYTQAVSGRYYELQF